MFLQVYKCFFCSKTTKTNRRSLRWVEIGICIGRESSNVLNKICLFESCTFSLWYSLNHLKVLEKNSFDSWQYKKVCSIESGLRQKGHLSSEANLCFRFFLCRDYSVHSLKKWNVWAYYLSRTCIYSKNNHANQEVLKSFFHSLEDTFKAISRLVELTY